MRERQEVTDQAVGKEGHGPLSGSHRIQCPNRRRKWNWSSQSGGWCAAEAHGNTAGVNKGVVAHPSTRIGHTGRPAGHLQASCRPAAGQLQASCRPPAGHLQASCRPAAGHLQATCKPAEGRPAPVDWAAQGLRYLNGKCAALHPVQRCSVCRCLHHFDTQTHTRRHAPMHACKHQLTIKSPACQLVPTSPPVCADLGNGVHQPRGHPCGPGLGVQPVLGHQLLHQ